MSAFEIHQFPCLRDNYGVLIHDADAGVTASIDAPDEAEVMRALAAKGWTLTHILTTHHHADHTAGNRALKAATGCTIVGPRNEAQRVPGIDVEVGEPDVVKLGRHEIKVIDTPGHTLGHVSYWIPGSSVAFVGDTLFAMGCGRVLEGTPEMMWRSLKRIARLPADTKLYCGHEYTLANAKFALTIEPENQALVARVAEVEAQRAAGEATLPTSVARELETNVFLRPHVAAIRRGLGMRLAQDWEVFAELRRRKNRA